MVVTADTDFVTMLALTGASLPSVVLVRRATGRRTHQLFASVLSEAVVLGAVGVAVGVGLGVLLSGVMLDQLDARRHVDARRIYCCG